MSTDQKNKQQEIFIVCAIDKNNNSHPSSAPLNHYSVESARTECERLVEKHPRNKYGYYKLLDVCEAKGVKWISDSNETSDTGWYD